VPLRPASKVPSPGVGHAGRPRPPRLASWRPSVRVASKLDGQDHGHTASPADENHPPVPDTEAPFALAALELADVACSCESEPEYCTCRAEGLAPVPGGQVNQSSDGGLAPFNGTHALSASTVSGSGVERDDRQS
jgi:hypothetical protein